MATTRLLRLLGILPLLVVLVAAGCDIEKYLGRVNNHQWAGMATFSRNADCSRAGSVNLKMKARWTRDLGCDSLGLPDGVPARSYALYGRWDFVNCIFCTVVIYSDTNCKVPVGNSFYYNGKQHEWRFQKGTYNKAGRVNPLRIGSWKFVCRPNDEMLEMFAPKGHNFKPTPCPVDPRHRDPKPWMRKTEISA